GITPPPAEPPAALVADLGEAAKQEAIKLVARLRGAGLAAQLPFGDRSLKAQLKSANRLRARYAVILGEEELARGEATLRNLASGEQSAVPLDEVETRLRRGIEAEA
ncbi:MAG: histidine--tRNA ligase, partial [Caldilineae bacterium]